MAKVKVGGQKMKKKNEIFVKVIYLGTALLSAFEFSDTMIICILHLPTEVVTCIYLSFIIVLTG